MRILHTESSSGWGGQEIRILKESLGLRTRGHELFFAIEKGGGLVREATAHNFLVYELHFQKLRAFCAIRELVRIIRRDRIDLVVTHSSKDAWLGGIAARLAKRPVLRLRHLSTPIIAGLNVQILYKGLADFVVTTSSLAADLIAKQAKISPQRCICIPTGVDPEEFNVNPEETAKFRKQIGAAEEDILVGSVCFMRSWKGVEDFLKAAALLKGEKRVKWVLVGGGYLEHFKPIARKLGVEDLVVFTGHLAEPHAAISALDIFLLLSTANEGISQASLQAAYLQKPLITTPIGGLPEVCRHGKTGLIVPPFSPEKVAEAVMMLVPNLEVRKEFGKNARRLVEEKFLFSSMLDQMENTYRSLL